MRGGWVEPADVGAVCVGVLWCGWVTFCNLLFLR